MTNLNVFVISTFSDTGEHVGLQFPKQDNFLTTAEPYPPIFTWQPELPGHPLVHPHRYVSLIFFKKSFFSAKLIHIVCCVYLMHLY